MKKPNPSVKIGLLLVMLVILGGMFVLIRVREAGDDLAHQPGTPASSPNAENITITFAIYSADEEKLYQPLVEAPAIPVYHRPVSDA